MKACRVRDRPGRASLRQSSRVGEFQVESWSYGQMLHADGQRDGSNLLRRRHARVFRCRAADPLKLEPGRRSDFVVNGSMIEDQITPVSAVHARITQALNFI